MAGHTETITFPIGTDKELDSLYICTLARGAVKSNPYYSATGSGLGFEEADFLGDKDAIAVKLEDYIYGTYAGNDMYNPDTPEEYIDIMTSLGHDYVSDDEAERAVYGKYNEETEEFEEGTATAEKDIEEALDNLAELLASDDETCIEHFMDCSESNNTVWENDSGKYVLTSQCGGSIFGGNGRINKYVKECWNRELLRAINEWDDKWHIKPVSEEGDKEFDALVQKVKDSGVPYVEDAVSPTEAFVCEHLDEIFDWVKGE